MIASWPFPSRIPTPRISTFNLRGLSAYHKTTHTKLRYLTLIGIITSLAKKSDVILLQETHLNPKEKYEIQNHFPSRDVFYNNKNSKSQGNAIMVAPLLHKNMHILHQVHIVGATHSLIFRSQNNFPTFQIFNIYLPSWDNWPPQNCPPLKDYQDPRPEILLLRR